MATGQHVVALCFALHKSTFNWKGIEISKNDMLSCAAIRCAPIEQSDTLVCAPCV